MAKRNVFIVGLDEFNLEHNLDTLLDSSKLQFHELLSQDEIKRGNVFAAKDCMTLAEERLRSFPGTVDGIVQYWDFPSCLMVPILCERRGLPTVSSRTAFACEHKYWCRVEQEKSIGGYPPFAPVAPHDPGATPPLEFPFWLKPVIACLGMLGFHIESRSDFDRAIAETRDEIPRFGQPYGDLAQFVDLPDEIAKIDGFHSIAEGIIGGRQCTIEGYAYDRDVVAYGVVDSFVYPDTSVFSRLEYPSKLPREVIQRMEGMTSRFFDQIGFHHGPFNIEFYWDEGADELWLLEVNTRISQSHSNLFKKVDGISHHKMMIDLALGDRPTMPRRQGPYASAAKFMYNVFEDGFVERVPTAEEVERVEQRFDAAVRLKAVEGKWLSDHLDRDQYSFPLAEIWLGAQNDRQLLEHYEQCVDSLSFDIVPRSRGGSE